MADSPGGVKPEAGYLSVARTILKEIRTRGLSPGTKLPSLRVLADRYGVGKAVVEQAFKWLAEEGVCRTVQGKGTFLAAVPPEEMISAGTVGIVLNYLPYSEENHPFYRAIYEGAAGEAVRRLYNILCIHHWDTKSGFQKKSEIQSFSDTVAGFVALGVYNDEDYLRLRRTDLPVVAVDYDTVMLGVDCVLIDDRGVVSLMTRELLRRGVEEVFFVDIFRTRDYDPSVKERRRSFEESVKSHGGVDADVLYLDDGGKDVAPLAERLRKGGGEVGIVCCDEFAASRLLDRVGLETLRGAVVSYVGGRRPAFPGLEKLPAVIGAVEFRELGRAGIRLLEERIRKGPGRARCIRISGRLVEWNVADAG